MFYIFSFIFPPFHEAIDFQLERRNLLFPPLLFFRIDAIFLCFSFLIDSFFFVVLYLFPTPLTHTHTHTTTTITTTIITTTTTTTTTTCTTTTTSTTTTTITTHTINKNKKINADTRRLVVSLKFYSASSRCRTATTIKVFACTLAPMTVAARWERP